jgi:peptidyl-prolyl cis-trans isomerase D
VARLSERAIVFHVLEEVPHVVPSFEQARDRLRERLAADRARADEEGARRLYDADPVRFATGRMLHYSRLVVPRQDILGIPLTREEVEAYHRKNLDDYSAPEMIHVSHILVEPASPDAASDEEARRKAQGLLDQLRGGADFFTLARDNSDDIATREKGGDLGAFQRGTMLPDFERVAFAMKPGDLSEPVRTSLGYHIIKCTNYLPAVVQPLAHVYANAAASAAMQKADTLARARADSLLRSFRTVAQARDAARRLGILVDTFSHPIGSPPPSTALQPYFDRLATIAPGKFYPLVQHFQGQGFAVTWVDSITAARAPSWEDARARAIEAYQRSAGERAVAAKRAELDSMLASGWTLDSLATLWGGLETLERARMGTTLAGFGGRAILDSLLFGGDRPPALATGSVTDWVELPGGPVRIRVDAREQPSATEVESRVAQDVRLETERALTAFYESLKQRFPVRILDPGLRAVALPPIPAAP